MNGEQARDLQKKPEIEGAPIEQLVLYVYRSEWIVGAKVLGCQDAKPERGIGQSAIELRKLFIGYKGGRSD